MKPEIVNVSAGGRGHWLKRAGLGASLLFLAKGLLWILVPMILAWFGGRG